MGLDNGLLELIELLHNEKSAKVKLIPRGNLSDEVKIEYVRMHTGHI